MFVHNKLYSCVWIMFPGALAFCLGCCVFPRTHICQPSSQPLSFQSSCFLILLFIHFLGNPQNPLPELKIAPKKKRKNTFNFLFSFKICGKLKTENTEQSPAIFWKWEENGKHTRTTYKYSCTHALWLLITSVGMLERTRIYFNFSSYIGI